MSLMARFPNRFSLVLLTIAFSLTSLVAAAQAPAPTTQPQVKPATPAPTAKAVEPNAKLLEGLSAAEFSRLVREFSEEGGFFRSDNFTSNETSYLHVVNKLKELGATGGAYLGVGPEQNFTYIAKIRPRIAFIVDIRRQAIIQHLMYKAVFHLAPDRPQFLSRLFSRAIPKDKTISVEASINELTDFFDKISSDDATYAANLAAIKKTIQTDFQFPLSEADIASLEYVYRNFRADGLAISYRMENSGNNYFPTLKEILVETDLTGKQGNFLASVDDYKFVRELHRKNLIVPIVGDFGGKKALASVGEFLTRNGLAVTAFYTSNVEQYLFGSELFAPWAANIKKLPLTEKSVFIRAIAGRTPHPARVPGHRLATLLQQMTGFLQEFDQGKYQTYGDLIMSQYISAER